MTELDTALGGIQSRSERMIELLQEQGETLRGRKLEDEILSTMKAMMDDLNDRQIRTWAYAARIDERINGIAPIIGSEIEKMGDKVAVVLEPAFIEAADRLDALEAKVASLQSSVANIDGRVGVLEGL